MNPESTFLIALGQALATMALYGEGHPARERALAVSFEQLLALTAANPCVEYSFLGREAVVGNRVMHELGTWDWGAKLCAARIERIEIDADVTREAYDQFIDELYGQVAGRCVDTAEMRFIVRPPIRFGRLAVRSPDDAASSDIGELGPRPGGTDGTTAAVALSLAEEIAAVRWVHDEVQRSGRIPMSEAETVVRSLSTAMHQNERMLVPLLQLKEYDQYTTTHACNVAVLSMALAERLGLAPAEVRAVGIAGMLHDIGKIAIPRDLLIKPGRFTDEERQVVQRHPVEGAKMIMGRERGLGLAAVVAYEHHVYLNGGGYPSMRYPRACHFASRIVHVCDIYDALCTNRPYRQAWEPDQTLAYLVEQAGRELDPEIVKAFCDMIGEAQVQRMALEADAAAVPAETGDLPAAPLVQPAQ